MRTDELGRAFEVPDSQQLAGSDVSAAHAHVLETIASLLATSLGPNGMDKVILSSDNEITMTNDGATILNGMEMTRNPVSQLVVELSNAQDEEIGDGTTSIVILASALLAQARVLIQKGIHPIKISEGYELAVRRACEYLESIGEPAEDVRGFMIKAAKTSLGSKIVNKALDKFAEICTEAVLSVCDQERKDMDFDLIKIEKKIGLDLGDTALIKGVVINKEFSHPQMRKEVRNARIAILSCPFEPPKVKTKHNLLISTVEDYRNLEVYESRKFLEMIECVKKVGADVVVSQWGFDDEANSLLMDNDLPAIRWVGGSDLEAIALHTNGSIVARFEDLREEDLGRGTVRELSLGTEDEKVIIITSESKAGTILIRGGTEMAMEEAKRCVRDALCAARNVLLDPRVVYGGGSSELAVSIFLQKESQKVRGEDAEALLAFSRALEEIPLNLAKNSGHDAMRYVAELKSMQCASGDYTLGVDCLGGGSNMRENGVFDALKAKTHMMQMATQLVTIILKIDDVTIEA